MLILSVVLLKTSTFLMNFDFKTEQLEFRKQCDTSLSQPNGWLAVAALEWLKEGSQTIGSGPDCNIKFPKSAPLLAGTIKLIHGNVELLPSVGVHFQINNQPAPIIIKTDEFGSADKIKLGNLTFSIIKRGNKYGIRLWDPEAITRKEFKGCHWFEAKESWVVQAKFVAHNPPKSLPITNILGDTELSPNPGYVEFKIAGKTHRLEAIDAGDELFFNFKDLTNGGKTYGAGRFLYTKAPKNGQVTLDFNQAVNPPCAYTAFATCPLPPKANYLQVAIEAGELKTH
jgi:uncharacterized protein (DUF1684 family)